MNLIIRWMNPRDIDAVVDIEFESFDYPWERKDFVHCLGCRDICGIVAQCGDNIVGYAILERKPGINGVLHIDNIACAPDFRRQGICSKLVKHIITLAKAQKFGVSLEIRETNLPAQLFFKSNGFKATKIISDCYEESSEDAYHFRHDGMVMVASDLGWPSEVFA